jgi:hypothetical protein
MGVAAAPTVAHAALDSPADKSWDGSEPPQGVYFYWYGPSFYAGFGPRTQDPSRPHIELSRGNQVRVTIPLGDAELDAYLSDLVVRQKTYQELIDKKVITLTTNNEYERFVEGLKKHDVERVVESKASLGPEGYRRKTIEILSDLNPDRIIHVNYPIEDLAAQWHKALSSANLSTEEGQLDAANALLPGRIDLYEIGPDDKAALSKAAELAQTTKPEEPAFKDATVAFLEKVSHGHYPVGGGKVDALEFSTIYPAGTIERTTTYKGETLPFFGVTGIWPLIRRTTGRGITGMVDYLSPNPGYGFITMFPYEFAGGIAYNAFHNAGVRCQLNSTPFLPGQWRKVPSERDSSKDYQNLWIASRAPTSHGCTRLGSGHMSEFRQLMPTSSDDLVKVPTYRNEPFCYDVFDFNAEGKPQVMGVQYYLAFRSTNDHVPIATYVTNKREPFYRWLYGDNVNLGPVGSATLKSVPVCKFVGRKAVEGQTFSNVPLFEAKWTPETIQFYDIKGVAPDSTPGFEFNRELRKVGHGHQTDRAKLLLK